jgi:deoxyribodipyrimidine photo-lyase
MIEPSYIAALTRLSAFLPHAGYDYTTNRNYDRADHPHVSGLSPYLRHRIITEDDVLKATLARHSPQAADKFIAEVYWRTYWKGWLEMRPTVWSHYKSDLSAAMNRVQTESGLRADWEAACTGQTGIDCFDHWAKELAATGYLHNHARMWFASIWIFTLRLPWTLGADFFMRHLLDGDPATNTLSWRWVGGLQTVGKTYLARADNIAKYTDGRFQPKDLAAFATPLEGLTPPAPSAPPTSDPINPTARTGLLLTEEDLSPQWMLGQIQPAASAMFQRTNDRSPLHVAPMVQDFVKGAMTNTATRFADGLGPTTATDDLVSWAKENGITQIVTAYAPVGPTADALAQMNPALKSAGITLSLQIRSTDTAAWPYATKGFFKFKDAIPRLLPNPV